MKQNNETIEQLKKIALPSVIFICFSFFTIFLLDKGIINVTGILIITIIDLIIYLFILYIRIRGYKLKYFFLGKKYKEQLSIAKRYITGDNAFLRKFVLRLKKQQYRRTGNIFIKCESYTPFSTMWDEYSMFSTYEGGIDDDEFILCVIYDYLNSGGGLYKIFEQLSQFFSYKEFIGIVSISKKYTEEVKQILLDSSYEEVYSLIDMEEKTKKESTHKNEVLSKFEELESKKLDKYIDQINKAFETTAIDLYLNRYCYQDLPSKYEKVFYSNDKRKRIVFFINEKLNSVSAYKEKIEFDDELINGEPRTNEFHSRGYWTNIETFGIYENIDLAIKNLCIELQDFTEYNK